MAPERGLIQVYTGNGKGKTTAAVGLALRAKSRGLRVLFAQFMKEESGGELELLEKSGVEVFRFTAVLSPKFHPEARMEIIRAEAKKAIDKLRTMLDSYDLVVLDEFNILYSIGLIESREVNEFLDSKPPSLELVLTGRGAPADLIERADLVTEMKEIKHPYKRGVKARRGIEY